MFLLFFFWSLFYETICGMAAVTMTIAQVLNKKSQGHFMAQNISGKYIVKVRAKLQMLIVEQSK